MDSFRKGALPLEVVRPVRVTVDADAAGTNPIMTTALTAAARPANQRQAFMRGRQIRMMRSLSSPRQNLGQAQRLPTLGSASGRLIGQSGRRSSLIAHREERGYSNGYSLHR